MIGEIREFHDRVSLGWARATHAKAARVVDDYRIEGDAALRAAREDSGIGDVQVAIHRDAWTTQIARLEAVFNRTKQEELMLRQLRRNVRELDAALRARDAAPETIGNQRMSLFGAVGGAVGFGLRPWMLWSGALAASLSFGALQTVRLENAKGDLKETRRDLGEAVAERDGWKESAEQYQAATANAQAVARQNVAWLEAERRRAARAEAEERRRQREIQAILTGGGDAPTWSLRDTPEVSE